MRCFGFEPELVRNLILFVKIFLEWLFKNQFISARPTLCDGY